jgi:hypothetical protein
MKEKGNPCKLLVENPEGKRSHVDVNVRIILKRISKKFDKEHELSLSGPEEGLGRTLHMAMISVSVKLLAFID